MITSLLVLGFLLGVKHSLEADHVAAVTALATRARSLKDYVRLALVWGIGHASALLILGVAIIALGVSLPESVARLLEGTVGVVLIALGIDVLRRARRDQIHFHVHEHGDGTVHVHAHGHEHDARPHDRLAHEHVHPPRVLARALLVGGVHGLAGSAALVLIPLQREGSVIQALLYLGAFGLGSIAGMVSFSIGISLPLRFSVRHLGATVRLLEGSLAMLTIVMGCWITASVVFGG